MMIRGFMKTTSLTALVAAGGMLMGSSAYAADLGGGCCADLEARVAELEATTARKGNRVVSLTVYGQVNKALLFWDNDDDSDVYVVDSDYSTSRFGFIGTATMRPGWTAGYKMEMDLFGDANSNNVSEDNDEGFGPELRIRVNEVYVDSEAFGRFTIGQGSSAADGIAEIVLGNSYSDSSLAAGGGMTVDVLGGVLGDYMDNLDGPRIDRVRYDSPSFYGFLFSASWGEDDYWDVALRYKKEWNSIRLAAGIAYSQYSEGEGAFDPIALDTVDMSVVSGSISLMHIPTGIYVAFAAGAGDVDFITPGLELDSEYWYAQLGVERRWFGAGATTLYIEYGDYSDIFFAGTDAQRFGFGIVQSVDSAAMDFYAQATFWDLDDDAIEAIGLDGSGELTTVMAGAIIKF
jgi:hypothetical protein